MNFLVLPLQPAAGAAASSFCVQLSATGRAALAHPALGSARRLPPPSATDAAGQPRGGLLQQRTQHRTQCRANCMSKANF
ncbi:hypothetical protein [uncultured Hymenobacter sp.]|uniref:hypothetical protein n=1 Tax=uncultured Hymenobacter sp. TaxID=170016 RepID=UPI0035C9C173